MTVRIVAPDIYEKDAVGNFCIDLFLLLNNGRESVELYALRFDDDSDLKILPMDTFSKDIKKGDVIFCSYSIYDPYLDEVLALPNKKICYFHGVTPPDLLENFEPETASLCRKSLSQFHHLSQFDVLIANSKYIAKDLANYVGDKQIDVAPPVFNTRQFASFPKQVCEKNPGLFIVVGRIIPHKRIEDAITVFEVLAKQVEGAKLVIIGDAPNADYNCFLQRRVNESLLYKSISFLGKVPADILRAYYLRASYLINASLHEGYGIPVIEAMFYGLYPIVRGGNAMEELVERFSVGQIFTSPRDVTSITYSTEWVNEQKKVLFSETLARNAEFFVEKLKSISILK